MSQSSCAALHFTLRSKIFSLCSHWEVALILTKFRVIEHREAGMKTFHDCLPQLQPCCRNFVVVTLTKVVKNAIVRAENK
jgi:hypothetical protein